MKKILVPIVLLLVGCVQIPDVEESPQEKIGEEETSLKADGNVQEKNSLTEPDSVPLAPLPEQPSAVAVPVSSPVQSSPVPSQSVPVNTISSGWTIEPISIEEGETKVVYVKQ